MLVAGMRQSHVFPKVRIHAEHRFDTSKPGCNSMYNLLQH